MACDLVGGSAECESVARSGAERDAEYDHHNPSHKQIEATQATSEQSSKHVVGIASSAAAVSHLQLLCNGSNLQCDLHVALLLHVRVRVSRHCCGLCSCEHVE